MAQLKVWHQGTASWKYVSRGVSGAVGVSSQIWLSGSGIVIVRYRMDFMPTNSISVSPFLRI